jgi:hypothetical protein
VKRWENTFQTNGIRMQAGVTILMSQITLNKNLKIRSKRQRKSLHIDETTHQEDIIIVNKCSPNVSTIS